MHPSLSVAAEGPREGPCLRRPRSRQSCGSGCTVRGRVDGLPSRPSRRGAPWGRTRVKGTGSSTAAPGRLHIQGVEVGTATLYPHFLLYFVRRAHLGRWGPTTPAPWSGPAPFGEPVTRNPLAEEAPGTRSGHAGPCGAWWTPSWRARPETDRVRRRPRAHPGPP